MKKNQRNTLVLTLFFLTTSVFGAEETRVLPEGSPAVGVSLGFLDMENRDLELITRIDVTLPILRSRTGCTEPDPPDWCYKLPPGFFIRGEWIGPGPDPWVGRLVIDDFRPDDPVILDVADLEIGDTFILTAGLKFPFASSDRWSHSLYLGGGFMIEEGATTEIAGVGTVKTTNNTSPLAVYGFSSSYRFSERTALRLDLGAHTSFMDSMDVILPNGTDIPVQGDTMTSVDFAAGVIFRF